MANLDLAEWLASPQWDPRASVAQCLAQVERREGELQAWVLTDADGAREAAESQWRRRLAGQPLGRLAGVPVGVKDIFDVAGWPTRAGARVTSDAPCERDCPVVARLRAADAIFVGKTVTTEFACFDPPPTRNPWNPEHTPGGSSSGSAAALAADMCWAALGSQTGGSITRPAAFCGVVGLKPSWGALPCDGVTPISFHLDHPGPMARRVADLIPLWETLAGRPAGSALAGAAADASEPLRIAWLDDDYWTDDAAQQAALDEAARKLAAAGCAVERRSAPADLRRIREHHRVIMAVEAAEHHRVEFSRSEARYGPHVAELIRFGLAAPALDYAAALKRRLEFRRQLRAAFSDCDLIMTPSAPGPAPLRDSTGDPRCNSIWSFSGFPTVGMPCGRDPGGLPLGLQLASTGSEDRLLQAAARVERLLDHDESLP